METKSKKYKYKIHCYLTEAQSIKLQKDSQALMLTKSDVFRKTIDKEFIYVSLFSKLLTEFRKQGINLNQVAKHTNETKQAGDEILPTLKNIEKIYRDILNEVKRLK
ncbi:Hypothetical protein mma_2528 [Janthinobacterium sp. Marseille]|nr:plasmid mobilization relaxosome protein MobC [Janthinobacterium sp. Marseille]ABR91886.1 Hypothetical protein mma_2528 [Janthinobacterium sp. Marseille]